MSDSVSAVVYLACAMLYWLLGNKGPNSDKAKGFQSVWCRCRL